MGQINLIVAVLNSLVCIIFICNSICNNSILTNVNVKVISIKKDTFEVCAM